MNKKKKNIKKLIKLNPETNRMIYLHYGNIKDEINKGLRQGRKQINIPVYLRYELSSLKDDIYKIATQKYICISLIRKLEHDGYDIKIKFKDNDVVDFIIQLYNDEDMYYIKKLDEYINKYKL